MLSLFKCLWHQYTVLQVESFFQKLNAFFSHQSLLLQDFHQCLLKTNQLTKKRDKADKNISIREIFLSGIVSVFKPSHSKAKMFERTLWKILFMSITVVCYKTGIGQIRFLPDCSNVWGLLRTNYSILQGGPGTVTSLSEPVVTAATISGKNDNAESFIDRVFLEVHCLTLHLFNIK